MAPKSAASRFTAFIPFCDAATNPCFQATPRLKISIHGHNGRVFWHETQMDTGSTGMVVSAWELGYTDASQLSRYPYGTHFLSSSKTFYTGHWIPVKFSFLDSGISSNVSVFAVVSTGKCLDFDPEKGVCQELVNQKHMPAGIAYLGVGFGRYGPEQPNASSDKNPLINITYKDENAVPSQTITQGYIITDKGVHVGLTPELKQGFSMSKLSESHPRTTTAELPEWNAIPMSLNLSSEHPNVTGTVLFDTGISQMYLGVPKDAYASLKLRKVANSTRVVDGTHFTLKVGQNDSVPMLEWPVTVGGDRLTTPVRVLPRLKKPGKAFINSGRNIFKRYDFLFDAENGLVGMRQRRRMIIPVPRPESAALNQQTLPGKL